MRINSKVPKTFSIFARKKDKSGYLRFVASSQIDDKVVYTPTFVNNINNASKFVNFDNVKKKALLYCNLYKFDESKIFDDKLMKYYYVKKDQNK